MYSCLLSAVCLQRGFHCHYLFFILGIYFIYFYQFYTCISCILIICTPNCPEHLLTPPPPYLHQPQPLPAGMLTDLVDLILCPTCHITTVVMSLGVHQPCYVQETASLSTLSHPQAHPVLPALLPPCSLSLDLSQHIHLSSVF